MDRTTIRPLLFATAFLALAQAAFAVGAASNGAPGGAAGRPPALVDVFSPSDIVGVDLPMNRSVLYPYGIAVKRDGTLIVACGTVVFALDRRWNVIGLPAKRLTDEGNYNFAYSMALTPADTIYLRSTDGTAMWAFADGSQEYRRIRAEGQPGSAFGVLDDGSPFVAETQSLRIYGSGGERRVVLPEGSSTMAASAGPEGTLWVADMASGTVLVYSAEGAALKTMKLDLPAGVITMRLRVLRDGGFIATTSSDIRRFDASGRTLWIWNGRDDGVTMQFSTYTEVALGPDGILYVNDLMGKRLLRLAERPEALPADLARVASASAAMRRAPDDPARALALADAYEAMGASEAARAALERYLDDRPADAKAQDRRQRLETALLKAKAKAAERDVFDLLSRFGAETAREAYGRTMKTYEALRASAGDDDEVRASMAALRNAFQAAERGAVAAAPSPKVVSVRIAALFPALMRSYRTKPAGSITIRNTLTEPIRAVRADLFIKKYMDFPSEGVAVAAIDPGKEATLDVLALLNEAVLEVQEDIPLQAQITIRYSDARGERTLELSRPVTLYRRTAISWDETGRLAAFITPNEETIARLGFDLVGSDDGAAPLSTAFSRAMRLCDALGALPLAYVKDPQSPIGDVLGAAGSVDTVRFPRTTLAYKGGDCDDTTALLASLLEAVGIPTAIMTSPGHVFMAFDTGEPEYKAWLLSAPGLRTVRRGGTLWIPIETTILPDGFIAAWRAASELVDMSPGSDGFEFLPVAGLWRDYPPLPLSVSTLPVPAPDAGRRSRLTSQSASAIAGQLYEPGVRALETERRGQVGAEKNRTGNRLAELHFRFGKNGAAEATLAGIVKDDPTYLPAYLNLAALCAGAGRTDEAKAYVRRAAAIAPGSAAVAAFAKASGLGGELGFGPALAGTGEKRPGGQPLGGQDRASSPTLPAWIDE